MFHGLLELAFGPPPKGKPDANCDKPCQWYNLWMRIKGPHKYMVTTLGLCVKWPYGYMIAYETYKITILD